jgi:hypothetical protein
MTADTRSARITNADEHLPARTLKFISEREREQQCDAEEKQEEEVNVGDALTDATEIDSDMTKKGEGKDSDSPESYVEPKTIQTRTYEGPLVEVCPKVQWQNPERKPHCSHIQASKQFENVPPTATVRVVAKLSIQYDAHLARETKTYQSFPSHLFEHWNGYNVIPPLQDPVPVGAVVPQFYGYYIPDENTKHDTLSYLSPILLLEDCGIPIDADELNKDDRQECASLLYRLHNAGWTHGSLAERNLLMQPGPLSDRPLSRGLDGTSSFRLIDFGRSVKCDSSSCRAGEERAADRMFHIQKI